ncbi:MAG: ABC transporter permease subunit [Anaerolineales bacterium]|nr:ABC transporter permease subunit [Anaerolineales bacterium]MCB8990799.1 ABC transporter permease subunit [Ardenticatenaceae bacterium]
MDILIIAQLTVQETQRRRILWIALVLALAFLALFAIGFHYVYADAVSAGLNSENARLVIGVLLSAGLYATNFLIIVISVITSVTAVSGEIESHTVETLLTKPMRRWELILGKWLGFAAMLVVYIVLLAGGIVLYVYWRTGFWVQNLLFGFSLMVLQGLLILSLTIAGGTRLSSLANGVLAFMLYGLASLGGWVEQIGAMLRNETAVNVGIVTSLIMPSEVLWKKALALFQPQFSGSLMLAGPFSITSQPSNLMLIYALVYMLALLGIAMWSFTRRDL